MTALLRSYQFVLLHILQLYYVHCMSEGNPIGDNWSLVTADEFNEFASMLIQRISLQAVLWAPSIVSSMTQARYALVDPVADFKTGIKHAATLFVAYKKDESQWDNWQRLTNAQACAQGVLPSTT